MDLETLIGRKTATAVQINDLVIPAASLTKYFNSFAGPGLFVVPEASPFDLSKSGSVTKISIASRYFVLCMSHQISVPKYEFQELCLHNVNSGRFVTSHAATYSNASINGIDDDLMLFEFTEAVKSGSLSQNGWYNISAEFSDQNVVATYVAVGYPSHRNSIDYEEKHCAQGPNAVWGKPRAQTMPNRVAVKIDPVLDYDPDGLSGGPVFGISLNNFEPVAGLAGIISNSSKSTLNFVDRVRIRDFLKFV